MKTRWGKRSKTAGNLLWRRKQNRLLLFRRLDLHFQRSSCSKLSLSLFVISSKFWLFVYLTVWVWFILFVLYRKRRIKDEWQQKRAMQYFSVKMGFDHMGHFNESRICYVQVYCVSESALYLRKYILNSCTLLRCGGWLEIARIL